MHDDPERIAKLLKALEAAWTNLRFARLGQLVCIAAMEIGSKDGHPFYTSDELMLKALEHLAKARFAPPGDAPPALTHSDSVTAPSPTSPKL